MSGPATASAALRCRQQLVSCDLTVSALHCGRQLRGAARAIPGKAQLFINAYARALEVIPRQLCDNAGFDATDVLNRLRMTHAVQDGSGRHFGVDINTGARSTWITLAWTC